MKYAIVKIGPFQYKLEEGKEYSLPKFEATVGKKFEVKEVLAIADGEKIEFGTPFLSGVSVTLDILEQGKGEKVRTMTYKAKSRYRKQYGFRIRETRVKVGTIGAKTKVAKATKVVKEETTKSEK